MVSMQSSIFTQIIKRELPAEILYEDEMIIAILTIMPHHPGHSLIIPKKQVDKIYELDQITYKAMFDFAQRLAKILEEIYQPKRVGYCVEGLAIAHAHIHLIPIDNIGDMDHDRARPTTPAKMKVEADKIRQKLAEF